MSLLPFSDLPPYKPRRFVPANLNLGDWSQIAPLFDTLEKRITEIKETKQLEDWLLDWGELTAALEEEGAKRYIDMSLRRANADPEKAHLEFIEKIYPRR